MVFGTEIWALIVVLLFQDLPFFIVRLMLLIYNDVLQGNYNLYFFVAKNFILIFFELYYIISIIIEHNYYERKKKMQKSFQIDIKEVNTVNNDKEIHIMF